jgi:hypothetical protein
MQWLFGPYAGTKGNLSLTKPEGFKQLAATSHASVEVEPFGLKKKLWQSHFLLICFDHNLSSCLSAPQIASL